MRVSTVVNEPALMLVSLLTLLNLYLLLQIRKERREYFPISPGGKDIVAVDATGSISLSSVDSNNVNIQAAIDAKVRDYDGHKHFRAGNSLKTADGSDDNWVRLYTKGTKTYAPNGGWAGQHIYANDVLYGTRLRLGGDTWLYKADINRWKALEGTVGSLNGQLNALAQQFNTLNATTVKNNAWYTLYSNRDTKLYIESGGWRAAKGHGNASSSGSGWNFQFKPV